MAAPFSRVLSKTDDAIVAFMIAAGAGTADTVVPAKASIGKAPAAGTSLTVVYSSSAVEECAYSGRYVVSVAIMVKTIGADDVNQTTGDQKTTHDENTGDAFDAAKEGDLNDSDALATAINDAVLAAGLTDYTVFAVVEDSQEAGVNEDCWVETINLKVTCCCSTVA